MCLCVFLYLLINSCVSYVCMRVYLCVCVRAHVFVAIQITASFASSIDFESPSCSFQTSATCSLSTGLVGNARKPSVVMSYTEVDGMSGTQTASVQHFANIQAYGLGTWH